MSNNPLPTDSSVWNQSIQRRLAKTSAERSREYRDRQRLHRSPKKPPKTAAERVREYRARQKAKAAIQHANQAFVDPLALPTDSVSSSASSTAIDKQPISILKPLSIVSSSPLYPYKNFDHDSSAHAEFHKQFIDNPFGYVCTICDRLCFKNDIKFVESKYSTILHPEFSNVPWAKIQACDTCRTYLKRSRFPPLSKTNGFCYPKIPDNLPELDSLTKRLISPHLPFFQIHRFRHSCDSPAIYAQTINFPVAEKTLVERLPRGMNEDHCINVNINERKIQETRELIGLIDKPTLKTWLNYLVETPLYKKHGITIDEAFFEDNFSPKILRDQLSEEIPEEESLIADQQTLLWNDLNYFQANPPELKILHSSLLENHIEEFSFPSIYLGTPRSFTIERTPRVTPFMIMMSEIKRSDRRGVTPEHLFYMAMKMMTLRVRANLPARIMNKGTNDQERWQSEEFLNNFIESNLTFLRSLPNSPWHWSERGKDLLAMIRQIGRPTMSLTFQANEMDWNQLLQTLFKCRHDGCEISEEAVRQLTPFQKSKLVNDDAVTCALYFSALINVLMGILQSKKWSPFKQYRVAHYFKRIEFPHDGSTKVHVLLWLDGAPVDPLGVDKREAIAMIDKLISVSGENATSNIDLQAHRHGPTCYTKVLPGSEMCQYGAPFMPCEETMILAPMDKLHPGFSRYAERFRSIKQNLEIFDYPDMRSFYEGNQIISKEHYIDVLRAGISQPTVFLKREPPEKWHLGFNPFILNVLNSCIDVQFILDNHTCAAHVIDYVDKTNKGISDLRRRIMAIADENPAFDIREMTKKLIGDVLRTVEITAQEAAWYLLREPMCKTCTKIVYIPTVWPNERQTSSKKNSDEMEEVICDENPSEMIKTDMFQKYEERPQAMEHVTLAQFAAKYYWNTKNEYLRREEPSIIRYHNYDPDKEMDEYKREMVTLHLPFRCEQWEILLDNKFVELFDENEEIILQRRKEFEKDLDGKRVIDICEEICDESGETCDFGMRDLINVSWSVKTEPMME